MRQRAFPRWMVAVFLSVASCSSEAQSAGRPPGREIVPSEAEVMDVFLGYVVGLISTDAPARADREFLLGILPEMTEAPGFRQVQGVAWRGAREPGGPALSFWFDRDLDFPVPISIFGYHPGSIKGSSLIGVRETRRGQGEGNLAGPFYLFMMDQGYVQVDFDGWLDFLAGGILDDFSLAAFALVTYRGKWHAMLVGRGKRGQAVPWAIDLSRERILFPIPRELMSLAERVLQ